MRRAVARIGGLFGWSVEIFWFLNWPCEVWPQLPIAANYHMYQVPLVWLQLMARGSMYSDQLATSPRHLFGYNLDLSKASSIVHQLPQSQF
jgi:hypothetical protein